LLFGALPRSLPGAERLLLAVILVRLVATGIVSINR
jgi:hypothetical protein